MCRMCRRCVLSVPLFLVVYRLCFPSSMSSQVRSQTLALQMLVLKLSTLSVPQTGDGDVHFTHVGCGGLRAIRSDTDGQYIRAWFPPKNALLTTLYSPLYDPPTRVTILCIGRISPCLVPTAGKVTA